MKETELFELAENLLEAPCYVVDYLPRQVPADCGEQYWAVDRYYREPARLASHHRKLADLLIKLSCYYDMVLGDGTCWTESPSPALLSERIIRCAEGGFVHVLIPAEQALITLFGDDLNLTIYHPSEALLETTKALAASNGLFLWQPPQQSG